MKAIVVILTFASLLQGNTGLQFENATQRLRIDQISDMNYAKPWGYSDKAFWSIVRKGKGATADLLLLVEDSSPTEIPVSLFGGTYAVGDLAVMALLKIYEDLPVIGFVDDPSNPRYEDIGFFVYWNSVRADPANRKVLKEKVASWLEANKSDLIWVTTPGHPADGSYRLRGQLHLEDASQEAVRLAMIKSMETSDLESSGHLRIELQEYPNPKSKTLGNPLGLWCSTSPSGRWSAIAQLQSCPEGDCPADDHSAIVLSKDGQRYLYFPLGLDAVVWWSWREDDLWLGVNNDEQIVSCGLDPEFSAASCSAVLDAPTRLDTPRAASNGLLHGLTWLNDLGETRSVTEVYESCVDLQTTPPSG